MKLKNSLLLDSFGRLKTGEQENWWTNQKCDEFGWFKTSTVYNNFVTYDFVANLYCNYFGADYDADHVQEQVDATNAIFQVRILFVKSIQINFAFISSSISIPTTLFKSRARTPTSLTWCTSTA